MLETNAMYTARCQSIVDCYRASWKVIIFSLETQAVFEIWRQTSFFSQVLRASVNFIWEPDFILLLLYCILSILKTLIIFGTCGIRWVTVSKIALYLNFNLIEENSIKPLFSILFIIYNRPCELIIFLNCSSQTTKSLLFLENPSVLIQKSLQIIVSR